jgi:2-phosphosulfolactate phosphatase
MKSLEVLFTPAEFATLAQRDLRDSACVVFDILRATSSMVTALANGAAAVVPVLDIPEALAWRTRQPGVLLAGERNGVRIRGQDGAGDFDLGNSPREFTAGVVRGKTIVTTTTNGTRALRACAGARRVLAGSFLNLRATAREVLRSDAEELLLVCSGTHEKAAWEDTLAAGALTELILQGDDTIRFSDSAQMACEVFRAHRNDLAGAMRYSANGRRLLALPELCADVSCCLRCDVYDFAAEMDVTGKVTKAG